MNEEVTLHYTTEGTATDLVLVVGPRGGGKTTLMQALVPIMGPLDRCKFISPVSKLAHSLGQPNDTRYGSDKDNEEFFSGILRNGQRTDLIMDEFDEFVSGGVQGKFGGYCCDSLYRIVNYGRNEPWGIGMLVSFRGASDVTTNLLRAGNVMFAARQTEPNARAYIAEYLGDRQFEPLLAHLPNYVFVVAAEGRVVGFVRVNNESLEWVDPPEEWKTYVDSVQGSTSPTRAAEPLSPESPSPAEAPASPDAEPAAGG